MLTVTSTQNPRVRFLRDLHHAKARGEAGLFLVEGRKLCQEALRDAKVVTLLVDQDKTEAYAPLIEQAGDVLLAPAHVVASVCEAKTPQGIVAAVRLPAPLSLSGARGALLSLDGVQDPGNVGTMLRTAEAAGFSGALLSPACADAFSIRAVRASMGSVLRLPILRGDLPPALSSLKEKGYAILGTELGAPSFFDALPRLDGPVALVIGSEGSGVGAPVLAQCTDRVSLPMRGRAESLNAAVAAGILMYALMERPYADQPPV